MGTEIRVRGAADVTDAELHLYADGSVGDDTNHGRSAAMPKKTLTAILGQVPEVVRHHVSVHLSGVFEDTGVIDFCRVVMDGRLLVIDGGSGLVTVAGPFTATGSDGAGRYLDVAGAGWVPDTYAGYWVEVTSGPHAGVLRAIQENTTERLTVCRLWEGDSGLCTFRVVRPATSVRSVAGACALSFSGFGGDGRIVVQNLFLQGTNPGLDTYLEASYNSGRFSLNRMICIPSGERGVVVSYSHFMAFDESGYDANTFAYIGNTGCGVSVLSGKTRCVGVGSVAINASYFRELHLLHTGMGGPLSALTFTGGSRSRHLRLVGCQPVQLEKQIYNKVGFNPTKISGNTGVGLYVDSSFCCVGEGVVISDHGTHGIEAKNRTMLLLDGNVTGGNNGRSGVYVHAHSGLRLKKGTPPTLIGAMAECTTDDTTETTTWADVDSSPVSDLNEMTTLEAE